jgi:protein-tyrosine phosphatase
LSDIQEFFEETYEFIEKSKVVFVHCAGIIYYLIEKAGINRSGTIVIAYLMKNRNLSYEEAYKFTK